MDSLLANYEMSLLHEVADAFPRHPLQCNAILESDSEIIDISGLRPDQILLSTDGIHEEIRTGLYEDPRLVGWMCVNVAMSDLAAAGADGIGILIALQLPEEGRREWLQGFQSGVNDGCLTCGVHVLGGDTNQGDYPSVTVTALGVLRGRKAMKRTGIRAGDLLYTTALPGSGNAFAYSHFLDPRIPVTYLPKARMAEGSLISAFAHACMDTSDGLFPTLSVLCALNGTGFRFDKDLSSLLCPSAICVRESAVIPSWMLLAGPHGDFELAFAIPEGWSEAFESAYRAEFGDPILLGRFTTTGVLEFDSDRYPIVTRPSAIPDIFHRSSGNVNQYFQDLMLQHELWVKN
jgi:thiamine-monophosphate kinase